jgi:hypothetical protein
MKKIVIVIALALISAASFAYAVDDLDYMHSGFDKLYGGNGKSNGNGSVSNGPTYMHADCLSGYNDWAGLCCKAFDKLSDCERNRRSCVKVNDKELAQRSEQANRRSKAAPACAGND